MWKKYIFFETKNKKDLTANRKEAKPYIQSYQKFLGNLVCGKKQIIIMSFIIYSYFILLNLVTDNRFKYNSINLKFDFRVV